MRQALVSLGCGERFVIAVRAFADKTHVPTKSRPLHFQLKIGGIMPTKSSPLHFQLKKIKKRRHSICSAAMM